MQLVIPDGLLQSGQPGVVVDPDVSTQADISQAWSDTFDAWEGCAANMERIRDILAAHQPQKTGDE